MVTQTKFNIGDKVFTIGKDMKIKEVEIDNISIFLSKNRVSVKVHAKDEKFSCDMYDEETCFATKLELLSYIERD